MSVSKAAYVIETASTMISDSMPRECFTDPNDSDYDAMTSAKNAAITATEALTASVKSQVGGMSAMQLVGVWHSICSLCLHSLEQAVMTYERE